MPRPINPISSSFPEIVVEWDYEKNGALTPDQVSAGSATMVHWKCQEFGHQWPASPNHRTGRGSGCPYCGNKRVLAGFNDLETRFPEIAKEWDYEENRGLGPTEVLAGSATKVHWKCQEFGHQWEAIIVNRTRKGYGCPVCSNKQVLPGFNDLASQRKDIAEEWDYEKNGALTPDQVAPASNKKVHWKCKAHGHQ